MNKSQKALVDQAQCLFDELVEMAGEGEVHRLFDIGHWWRLVQIDRVYPDDFELSTEELNLLVEGYKLVYQNQGQPQLPQEKIRKIQAALAAGQADCDLGVALVCCALIVAGMGSDTELVLLFRMACERYSAALLRDMKLVEASEKDHAREFATRGAEALHSRPGGSRDKRKEIRAIWASGKYSSRSLCAEEECAALGMSYDTARRALRNVPKQT